MEEAKKELLSTEEKLEYLKWQKGVIEHNINEQHYLCIDLRNWLRLKNKAEYFDCGFNLTLFPELLKALARTVVKSGCSFAVDYKKNALDSSSIAYERTPEINSVRLKLLEKLEKRLG